MFLKGYDIPKMEKFDFFITKREGGFSSSKYESLNLSVYVGDDEKSVEQNRQFLAQVLWRNVKNFTYLKQVHKADVLVLDENTQYKQGLEYDAVITNKRILIPIVYVADCVPIVLCDEKREVFGTVHSGWKGTAEDILGNTISKMQSAFGSDIQDIKVIIGPCISQKNYEVDSSVVQHFEEKFYEKNNNGGYQLDLRSVVENQALKTGCIKNNIYHINNCSFAEKETFFSARKDGIESGRFAMGIYAK